MRDLRPLLVLAPAAAITGWLLALLLTFAATFTGCATAPSGGTVSVPVLPTWIQPADTRTISSGEVLQTIEQLRPGVPVKWADASYTLVSYAWLDRYLEWTALAGRIAGIKYTPESWDCDDFANAFRMFASRAAAKAGVRAAPLVASIHVLQTKPFANVPAGGFHALSAVATDRGIVVVEPQWENTGAFRVVPFAQYPNIIVGVGLD